MPATPVAWSQDLIVNPRRTGLQHESVVTQLTNGNILVAWMDQNDSGAGSPDLSDIIGRLFDAVGNPLSGDFRLNRYSSSSPEFDPNIMALPDGGFVVVYADPDDRVSNLTTASFSTNFDTMYDTFDQNLVHLNGGFIYNDTKSDTGNYGTHYGHISGTDKSIIASAIDPATSRVMSAYIGYSEPTGINPLDESRRSFIYIQTYDPSTDSVITRGIPVSYLEEWDPLLPIDDNYDETVSDVALASINNNKFVLVVGNRNGSEPPFAEPDMIEIVILDQRGSRIGDKIVIDNYLDVADVSVAGLSNGNFVVSWGSSSGSRLTFSIFANDGTVVRSAESEIRMSSALGQNCMAALPDGGFVLVSGNNFQRFDASGEHVGTLVEYTADTVTRPSVAALADGRFTITWSNGDIHTQIFDPRDSVNTTPVNYGGDGWQVGTAGDDAFSVAFDSDIVHGGAGHDTISDPNLALGIQPNCAIFGDAGNDTIIAAMQFRKDAFDGGTGTDTASFVGYTTTGVIADLSLQGWRWLNMPGGFNFLRNFENLTGGSVGDRLTGNGSANILNGGGGADTLIGNGSADTLIGGTGADRMEGGTQSDTYSVDHALDVVVEGSGLLDGSFDHVFASVSYTLGANVEALTLTANLLGQRLNISGTGRERENDTITGNVGNNLLSGLSGNDTLNGGEGNDTLDGGAGFDELNGGAGQDIASYANSVLSITLALDGSLMTAGDAVADTLSSIEGIAGGSADDGLRGDGNANILIGNGGRDTLEGMANNDVLTGGAGRDTLIGGAGADVFDYNALSESTFVPQNRDNISDFEANSVDLIDLSTLDANETTGTVNDQFTFIGGAGFTGLGQIRVIQNATDTFVDINSTGDTTVDMRIRIQGLLTLDAADFVL